jgi:myosin-crossreactive antigen
MDLCLTASVINKLRDHLCSLNTRVVVSVHLLLAFALWMQAKDTFAFGPWTLLLGLHAFAVRWMNHHAQIHTNEGKTYVAS